MTLNFVIFNPHLVSTDSMTLTFVYLPTPAPCPECPVLLWYPAPLRLSFPPEYTASRWCTFMWRPELTMKCPPPYIYRYITQKLDIK